MGAFEWSRWHRPHSPAITEFTNPETAAENDALLRFPNALAWLLGVTPSARMRVPRYRLLDGFVVEVILGLLLSKKTYS